jgi:hypothetical protein
MVGEFAGVRSLHPLVSLPAVLGVKGAARRLRRWLAWGGSGGASGGGSANRWSGHHAAAAVTPLRKASMSNGFW